MAGAAPFGQLQYRDVNGSRMAYVDEGEGDAIVFAHGNLLDPGANVTLVLHDGPASIALDIHDVQLVRSGEQERP
jgi:hypothetical protein